MKVAIGIPAYNEEKNIASVISKLSKFGYSIIVCDDGSDDQTNQIAEKMGALVITHKKNLGYGAAIGSLFFKAKDMGLDVLVTMDADGQHRPKDVKAVLDPILNEEADIVIGSRFLVENKEMPSYRKTGIKMITKLANTALDKQITDSQSGFRGYNKKVLSAISPSESGMGVSNEILIKASKQGFKIDEAPIKVSYEGDTSTHHPVSHGVSVIFSTMKFISIEHPLKFYGIPGIVFLGIGLFFVVWALQYFTETRQILTNLVIIGVSGVILGVVLVMNAILLYSIVNLIREKRN
ncbi:MAG: glycosyltransferase [Thaumarchaeota archaeon]|nr:glycosyltransferase [Nitrososphaerota archaeon]